MSEHIERDKILQYLQEAGGRNANGWITQQISERAVISCGNYI